MTGQLSTSTCRPGPQAEVPDFHTLDISELYVRVIVSRHSARNAEFVFDREPWCHIKIGHVEVKPDAFLKFNKQEQYFIEVDRASGDRTKLAKKLRQYVNLYEAWDLDVDGEAFPQVFYSVPDDDRRRVIHSVISPSATRACSGWHYSTRSWKG